MNTIIALKCRPYNIMKSSKIYRCQRWTGLEVGLQDNSIEVVKGTAAQDNAITTYALKGDRERCIVVVMENYLTKPVKKEEVREALSRCYSKESQSKSTGATEAISK